MTSWTEANEEQANDRFNRIIYWGTPLESTSWELVQSLIREDDSAYIIARVLYKQFMRVNPNYWTS